MQAATKIGKYGIGTKMIMLPIKLTSKIPRYPKLSKNAKRSSILLIKYIMTPHSPIYLVDKSRSTSKSKSRVYENLRIHNYGHYTSLKHALRLMLLF